MAGGAGAAAGGCGWDCPKSFLASGVLDGKCDAGVGERQQVEDLGDGEGRVGGGHDGADEHERAVEHGHPWARARTRRRRGRDGRGTIARGRACRAWTGRPGASMSASVLYL